MSRIAGIASARNLQDSSGLVGDMLMAMGPGVAGEFVCDSRAPAVLGSIGRSGSAYFSRRSVAGRELPTLSVVFDGAIYNREDFNGATRAKKSDAELLAELYLQCGLAGALERINGDFALALYDFRDGTLRLPRDRPGGNPRFHSASPRAFPLAAEPGA